MEKKKYTEEDLTIDLDGNWKVFIENDPEWFVKFFLPEWYDKIDFKETPTFLNKELQEIIKGPPKSGSVIGDVVMKVKFKTGEIHYLIVHIEVHGYRKKRFGEGMFTYFYRLRDKYDFPVTVIAIFVTDEVPENHDHYNYECGLTKLTFDYPVYLVKDQDEDELMKSDNPFALAVLACKYLIKTKKKKEKDMEERLDYKKKLAKFVFEQGLVKGCFSIDTLSNINSFVDNIMRLPSKKEDVYNKSKMAYIKEIVKKEKTTKYVDITLLNFLNEHVYGHTVSDLENALNVAEQKVEQAEQKVEQAEQKRIDLIVKLHFEKKMTIKEISKLSGEKITFIKKVIAEFKKKQ